VLAQLDSVLKERLRSVVDGQRVTEAELRKLMEEGGAWVRILRGQLKRSEQTLAELAADPASSLAEVADAFRRVNELQPDFDELQALLRALEERAREFRAAWLRAG
jgi:chromosome segregation ATPase